MKYFLLFIKIMPYVITLCKQIEEWCDDDGLEKNGSEKKTAVLSATETIFNGIDDLTTGGANETWNKIEPLISKTIDTICVFLF